MSFNDLGEKKALVEAKLNQKPSPVAFYEFLYENSIGTNYGWIAEEIGYPREEEIISEIAKSESQRKLMGMALAYKRGELKNASEKIKKIANSISEPELEKFASKP